MKLVRSLLVAMSVLGLAGSAMAAGKPNCEVKTKKVHVKDKAACEAKKGKWLEADTTTAAPTNATTTEPAKAEPAKTEPAKTEEKK